MAFSMEPEERGSRTRFRRLTLWLGIPLALLLAAAVGYVGYLSGRNAMAPEVTASYRQGRASLDGIDSPTPLPTYTPYPTYTPFPTPEPVVITATPSPTPEIDVQATQAASTAQANSTLDPEALTAPKGDGFYLVGEEIAAGVWRSESGREDCHWARYNDSNVLLGEFQGISGGVIRIRETDFIVLLEGCGGWTYLGLEQP